MQRDRNPALGVSVYKIFIPTMLATSIGATFVSLPADVVAANASAPYLVKAIVPRDAFVRDQPGALLLEDYGSFALYDVDVRQIPSPAPDIQIRRDANLLQFVARTLDTRSAPSSLSAPVSEAGLQVVQFIGPIKQEWLTALSARGVEPVQYIANNGYVVWTEAEASIHMTELIKQVDWLQFSSPLRGLLKIDPRLDKRIEAGHADDEADIVVQVYRHANAGPTHTFIESKRIVAVAQLGPLGHGAAGQTWSRILDFENLMLRVRVSDIPAIANRADVSSVVEYVAPKMMDEKQGIILAGDFTARLTTRDYLQFLVDHGFSQNEGNYPIVDVTDSTINEGGTAATVVSTADDKLHVHGDINDRSRVAYFNNCTGFANEATGAIDTHGTLNAGIIADYDQRTGYPFQDSDGQHLGLGINPFGRIGSTTIFLPQYSIQGCGGTDQGVISSNWHTGARISSNSWGAPVQGAYDASAQIYDAGVRDADPAAIGNQQLIYLFAAGNDGPDASTVGSPGTAKNVITVGASENLRPFSSPSNSHCGPDTANDPQSIADFSSRGPAQGERVKPELLAPGTHIQAGASNFAGYDGSGACVPYFPEAPEQQIFTYSSGTSHSTPAVAGIASLAYWWIEQGGAGPAAGTIAEVGGHRPPSPAMMKAWLLAHPSYLIGRGANDDLPSQSQGFGMPNMDDMFDVTPKFLVDQNEGFDNTGETRTYTLHVSDPAKPVRVALAYTDAPGALGIGSLVNDLDLRVETNGHIFRGNHFDHRWSVEGGSPDDKNNYEAVFLHAGTVDDLTITIVAANIAGNGVPHDGDGTDQDFALVCSNCVLQPTFTVSTSESAPSVCVGTAYDGRVDVASIEDFALPVRLDVSGLPNGTVGSTSPGEAIPPYSAVISIEASDALPSGHYPFSLIAHSDSITKSLNIDLSYVSGAPLPPVLTTPIDGATNVELHPTLTWQPAADSASYIVEVATDAGFHHIVAMADVLESHWLVTGNLDSSTRYYWRVSAKNGCGLSEATIFDDGFDDQESSNDSTFTFSTLVHPGDCPAGSHRQTVFEDDVESGAPGWGLGGIIGGSRWTIDGPSHAGEHAFRANHDPFLAIEQDLISPTIRVPSTLSNITLSFWNQQALAGIPGIVCFQGALLKISTDGGTSQTQVTQGLLTDPYDAVIGSNGSNPLQGKLAWCANPQPYSESVVDLSPYAGQVVRLSFAVADDSFDDSVGRPPDPAWALDDVKITGCSIE